MALVSMEFVPLIGGSDIKVAQIAKFSRVHSLILFLDCPY
jgi:hypothetical protein